MDANGLPQASSSSENVSGVSSAACSQPSAASQLRSLSAEAQLFFVRRNFAGPDHQTILRKSVGLLFAEPEHWFCRYTAVATLCLHLFSIQENEAVLRFKSLVAEQLNGCTHCVLQFYKVLPELRASYAASFEKEAVKVFFQAVESWNTERVIESLRTGHEYVTALANVSPNVEAGGTKSVEPVGESAENNAKAINAAFNCIIYTNLLKNMEIDRLFCGVLLGIQRKRFLRFDQKLQPGVALLSCHSEPAVRRWAQRCLVKLTEPAGKQDFDGIAFVFDIVASTLEKGVPQKSEFNLSESMSDYWGSFYHLLNAMSREVALQRLSDMSPRIMELTCTTVGKEDDCAVEALKVFTRLLLHLRNDSWTASQLGPDRLARQTATLILGNLHLHNWILPPTVPNNITQKDQRNRMETFLLWIVPLVESLTSTKSIAEHGSNNTADESSLAKTVSMNATLKCIVEDLVDTLLSDRFQDEKWPQTCRSMALGGGFRVLRDALRNDSASIPTYLVDEHLQRIMTTVQMEGDRETSEASQLASEVIIASLTVEVTTIRDADLQLRLRKDCTDDTTLESVVGMTSLIHENVWNAVCLQGSPSRFPPSLHAYLFSCWSTIAFMGEREDQETAARIEFDSACNFLLKSLVSYMEKMSQVSYANSNNIVSYLLSQPEWSDDVSGGLVVLLLDPHSDLRVAAQDCVSAAVGRCGGDSFMIMRNFIVNYPLQSLVGLAYVIDIFSDRTNSLRDTLIHVLPFFSRLEDALMALLDEGALSQAALVDPEKVAPAISIFWSAVWRGVLTVLQVTIPWSKTYTEPSKSETITKAVEIVLDLADTMCASRRAFQAPLAKKGEYLPTEETSRCLSGLLRWLQVTDAKLRDKAVNLACGLIHQIALTGSEADPATRAGLEAAAVGGKGGHRLSDEQKTRIFVALSELENGNMVVIDSCSENEDELESQKSKKNYIRIDDDDEITSISRGNNSPTSLNEQPANTNNVTHSRDDDDEAASLGNALKDAIKQANRSQQDSSNYDVDDFDDADDHDEFDEFDDDALVAVWDCMEAESQANLQKAASSINSSTSGNPSRVPQHVPRYPDFASFARQAKSAALKKRAGGSVKNSKLSQLRRDQIVHQKTLKANIAVARWQHASKPKTKDLGRIKSESSASESSEDESCENGIAQLAKAVNKRGDPTNPPTIRKPEPRRTIKVIDLPEVKPHPMEVRKSRARDEELQRSRIAPNLSELHRRILSWPDDATGDLPPAGNNPPQYRAVPERFDSPDQYVSIFEPLLILECWQQLQRAREETSAAQDSMDATCTTRASVDRFYDISFTMPLAYAKTLAEHDLVRLSRKGARPQLMANGIPIVQSASAGDSEQISLLGKIMTTFSKGDVSEFVVRVYLGKDSGHALLSLNPKTTWKILKLFSLTPVHREYAALHGMAYYGICNDILDPKSAARPGPPASTRALHNCMKTYGVNEPQATAILSALGRNEGFTLIQGPPGTGKTKTILGLVGALLSTHAGHSVNVPGGRPQGATQKQRLLICAPSNAAVDEIVKRLKLGILDGDGRRIQPKIVRVGQSESINASIRDVTLEELVERELNTKNSSFSKAQKDLEDCAKSANAARDSKNSINRRIEEVQLRLTKSSDVAATSVLDAELAALKKERWALNQKLEKEKDRSVAGRGVRDAARRNARKKVLSDSDLVCCTLSGSGHEILTSLPTGFETVIIDEAAQSVELSSLIPLKYGCRRCILVGDPNQLPPTVLSQVAAQYSYEQSLFVRIQNNVPSVVHLLSIQYRMHPQISIFPSRLFYESKLTDGPGLEEEKSEVWHTVKEYSPFRFFNVHAGSETTGRGHSLYNPKEAEIAVGLVDRLCTSFPNVNFMYRIGVITPYKQQLRELKRQFERRYGAKILTAVDFNTVDGFQGQEKDIIIFSCVRGGSSSGIGFLSDVRRMNVALTRAKHSLFVLGNSEALCKNRMWRVLIDDARIRGLLTDVDIPFLGSPLANRKPMNLTAVIIEKNKLPRPSNRNVGSVKSIEESKTITATESRTNPTIIVSEDDEPPAKAVQKIREEIELDQPIVEPPIEESPMETVANPAEARKQNPRPMPNVRRNPEPTESGLFIKRSKNRLLAERSAGAVGTEESFNKPTPRLTQLIGTRNSNEKRRFPEDGLPNAMVKRVRPDSNGSADSVNRRPNPNNGYNRGSDRGIQAGTPDDASRNDMRPDYRSRTSDRSVGTEHGNNRHRQPENGRHWRPHHDNYNGQPGPSFSQNGRRHTNVEGRRRVDEGRFDSSRGRGPSHEASQEETLRQAWRSERLSREQIEKQNDSRHEARPRRTSSPQRHGSNDNNSR